MQFQHSPSKKLPGSTHLKSRSEGEYTGPIPSGTEALGLEAHSRFALNLLRQTPGKSEQEREVVDGVARSLVAEFLIDI